MHGITNDTPIAILTVGQLKEALSGFNQPTVAQPRTEPKQDIKYVYGLRGIRGLFNVSHATAQRYKDTIIKDAVMQCGKKIVVDVDKALELFNSKK